MSKYVFNDVNYKVFGLVNQGVVASSVTTNKIHQSILLNFLHETLGIMNYTNFDTYIHYELENIGSGYEIVVKWHATKLKQQTVQNYLELIKSGKEITEEKTNWKSCIKSDLLNLYKTCYKIDFISKPMEKHFEVVLTAAISNEMIESLFSKKDIENPHFSETLIPLDISWEARNEILDKAFTYIDTDLDMYINTLRILEGKDFCVDYFIGDYYYRLLDMPKKAYPYLKRALKYGGDRIEIVGPNIYDYLGNIELLHHYNSDEAERYYKLSVRLGNTNGLLKLAYKYLCNTEKNKKRNALDLTKQAEPFFVNEIDENIRLSAYHIAASVYLWNDDYMNAERLHNQFLDNSDWCAENFESVNSYLILVLAKSNELFKSILSNHNNLITTIFDEIYKTWYYCIVFPEKDGLENYMIRMINQINGAKSLYS